MSGEKVKAGQVVGLDYKLHLGDGKAVDQSEPDDPMLYLHGSGAIVPGLEAALEGMAVGEHKHVVIDPKDAYGDHDPAGIQEVSRKQFPPSADIKAGMQFIATDEQGEPMPITVREVKGDDITIDLNHPLAGKRLFFDVTVRSVRAATPEEVEHGHPHGEEGHHHH